MRAYKVLIDGRSAFTGMRWPLPADERPGAWVHATGPLGLCVNGVHACTTEQLAQWIGEELWTIELGGEILHAEPAIVAQRGRLLGRVTGWDQPARGAFAEDCAARARGMVSEWPGGQALLAAVERFAAAGQAAPVGYWTAVLAGESVAGRRSGSEYDSAFARERGRQGQWLAAALTPAD